jgi:imidazolonepropionase-like amidohydrolase
MWAEDPTLARLVAAGPMISVPDGYPYVPWGSSCMLPVTSVDNARYEAARLLQAGADILKLSMESGESFGMTIPSLSAVEAAALVEVAHEYGTKASAHVLVAYDLGRALDAGVDDIAHMITDHLYDSLIARAINDDVYWVPTLELWYHVGHGTLDAAIGNLRQFVQKGGKVAVGTDYAGYDADFEMGMPMHELEYMIQAGMTPRQVIVAGTKHGAFVCNLEDELGTVEPGRIADILVVSGDPLRDIHALSDVRLVIHNGSIIRDER